MSRRPVAPLMFAVVLLAMTTMVTASDIVDSVRWYGDPGQGTEYAVAAGSSLAKSFTIQSSFRFTNDRSAPIIWLAGLASRKNGPPDALVLQWAQDETGWFPVWKLRLETRLNLLPPSFLDEHGGDISLVELADLRPQAGHDYRAVMSYSPVEATLSLMVEDVTAGAGLYAANLQLLPYNGVLYPAAGWTAAGPPPVGPGANPLSSGAPQVPSISDRGEPVSTLETPDGTQATPDDTQAIPGDIQAPPPPVKLLELTVSGTYQRHGLPLAIKRDFRSMLLEVSQEDGALSRKLGHEYLKDEDVGLRLEWPAEPVAGEVRVLSVVDDEENLLATASWGAGTEDIVIDADALPLGESLLVLEHVHGTQRHEIVRHTLRVIEAKIRVNYTIRGPDFDRGSIFGELTVSPDMGVVEDAELIVKGTYTGERDDTSPEPFVVLRHRLERLDEAVSLPLEIPAPPHSGTLRLETSVEPRHVAVAGGSPLLAVKGVDVVAEDPTLFPFVVNPWQESPDNLTNVSHWLKRPAGREGFVAVKGGRFVTGDGSPIRFLGVNCAFAGCFPDRVSAERLARQLARFGINLVRFHHMDMQEAPGGIWRRGIYPRQLDPQQLDRLDYFIYQLKQNGIYSNLNLHVSRTMSPQEGFPEPERRPDYDKGLSLFDPGIIAHQKAYARDLLTHRNPYTGNRYVDEPAIAMIEITNENGLILFTQWGGIDALPARYQEALDARWQKWLADRYETTQALAAAWGVGDLSAGTEIAANGRLDRGLNLWALETDEGHHATMRVVPGDTLQPLPALEVRVIGKGSVPWRPQFYHVDLDLQPGKLYLVSFWLKSDRPHTVSTNLMMHHDPWIGFGSFQPAVTTEWQRYEYAVRVPEPVEVQEGRVSFTNLEAGATYWIADLSVKEVQGDGQGLPPGEDLANGVSRPRWESLGMRSSQVQQDYIEFLWDVEQAYFHEMYRFIKEELGARAPVSGTQVQWSPPGIQAQLDYVDVHAYWNHPDFPGASWDASNWYVRNNSMTESVDGGTITSLARTRVAGKPYVVSEYNHPAPITFGSEAFLLTGAYGAFQDWDGLIAFAWSHDADFWPQRIPNFFDIKSHPTKLVTLPAVAALLLRGDVRPGEELVYAPVPGDVQRRRLLETTVFGVGSADGGIPPLTALEHRLALVVEDVDGAGVAGEMDATEKRHAPGDTGVLPPQGLIVTSDTGELRWERTRTGRAVVVIDTERSKAVIGYGGGRTFDLSDVTLSPGPTKQQGWSAITLTLIDGGDFASPGRILLTATGYAENVGMGWERLQGDTVTVRNRWGEAPSLVEGVPARIELPVPPEQVAAYALDGGGHRREPLPVWASEHDPGRAVFDIGPEYRTLWYEIQIAEPAR